MLIVFWMLNVDEPFTGLRNTKRMGRESEQCQYKRLPTVPSRLVVDSSFTLLPPCRHNRRKNGISFSEGSSMVV